MHGLPSPPRPIYCHDIQPPPNFHPTPTLATSAAVQVDENNLPTLGLGAKRKKLSLSLAMCDSPEEAGVARDIGVCRVGWTGGGLAWRGWRGARVGKAVCNSPEEAGVGCSI